MNRRTMQNRIFQLLTPIQCNTLVRVAQTTGRHWKSAIAKSWEIGRFSPHLTGEDGAVLLQIRNRHGAAWLRTLSMKDLEAEEDPRVTAHETNRREQARYEAAHRRASSLNSPEADAIQTQFENGVIEIEAFEAALYDAERAHASFRAA